MKKVIISLLLTFIFVGCKQTNPPVNPTTSLDGSDLLMQYSQVSLAGKKAMIYKSTNCGCCEGYARALRDAGVDITVIADNAKVKQVKQQYRISEDEQSCHTTVIDGYFVEGHVPLNAVRKLLSEKPTIDGISLPGMPIGTPGMEGQKNEIYNIQSLTNGKINSYLQL